MARIRTIKPSFWGDAAVAELSRDARLLLIGLISLADDDGRFLASSSAISGYVFPNDDISKPVLRRWIDELRTSGMVTFYTVGRLEYGVLPNYRKHQRISKPMASPLPAPVSGGAE